MAALIAREIVSLRRTRGIQFTTTQQLAAVVEHVVRRGRALRKDQHREQMARQRSKQHPATKVFQALRMAVNDELKHLEVRGKTV